ncbi:hypothetical protein NO1_2030 [Candidatus Termititenax aidoneus]|uniref:Uncharacterized protein n=1 Tax=Termititenax aidoneus TaxID=2218524 RepID=A0A388TEI8_TERA1|nr:hypothetical protein NO1_2030 [Candidatus Termititenax aidoneus]
MQKNAAQIVAESVEEIVLVSAARSVVRALVVRIAQENVARLIAAELAERGAQVNAARLSAKVLAERTVPADVPTPARPPVALPVQAIALYNVPEVAR